uniref:VWFA domain-containing protein n=1 Tax=Romanomermis culicivorax TaxID=13658 RepID=A0A915K8W3_ROMCU
MRNSGENGGLTNPKNYTLDSCATRQKTGRVTNMMEENVLQPLLVSVTAMTQATEAVRSILKIDDIVRILPCYYPNSLLFLSFQGQCCPLEIVIWSITRETLQDDEESGGIEFSIANYVHAAKRKRMLERKGNIRLGIMRHLFIILDLSLSMNENDFLPTRQLCSLKLLETFVEEFFDQNPISQLGLIVMKDKRAEKLNDLSGNARCHKQKMKNLSSTTCSGEPSLQNAFELASGILKFLPSHTSREVLVIVGSLTTCDPSNLYYTIQGLKDKKIRCSIISLSAEVHVYKIISSETGGIFNVALDQTHLKDLLSSQTVPPPVEFSLKLRLLLQKNLDSKLLRMGFPEHRLNLGDELSACTWELTKSGYFCPQCKAKYCTLPVECNVCVENNITAKNMNNQKASRWSEQRRLKALIRLVKNLQK